MKASQDVSAALEAMDNWNSAERNTRAIVQAAKDAELEANRLRGIRGH